MPSVEPENSADRSFSPDWNLGSADFASPTHSDNEENDYNPSNDPQSNPATPHTSDDDQLDNNDAPNSEDDPIGEEAPNLVQAQNAWSPRWLPWHDRLLIQVVERVRPFNAARGDATRTAWDDTAVEVLNDSTTNGTPVNRTGAACRARFQKLLKAHNVRVFVFLFFKQTNLFLEVGSITFVAEDGDR
jgi:hypothetical protein